MCWDEHSFDEQRLYDTICLGSKVVASADKSVFQISDQAAANTSVKCFSLSVESKQKQTTT